MTAETIQEPVGEPWHGLGAYRVRQEFAAVCALYGCPGVPPEALRIVEDDPGWVIFAFSHLDDMLHVVYEREDVERDPDWAISHVVSDLVCALRELHRADSYIEPAQQGQIVVLNRPRSWLRRMWDALRA